MNVASEDEPDRVRGGSDDKSLLARDRREENDICWSSGSGEERVGSSGIRVVHIGAAGTFCLSATNY